MSSPVLLYRPENVTNTSSNGGRMTNSQVVTTIGGAGNFPAVSRAEQLSGITRFRKVFAKVADATNPVVAQGTFFLKNPSLSADTRNYMIKGTQRDQFGAIGSRKYATGKLHANITASDTILVVDFEAGSGADLVVQTGDKIAIIEGTTENLDLYVDSISWSTDQATITLTTGVLNDFTTSASVASCIFDTVSINPFADNIVKSFSTSTYDDTTYPIVTNNLATDEQTITLTFTSTTAFSVLSDKHGALASGSVSTDYSPVNADFSLPYCTLRAAGWGGTHTIGETMQFQTHPAAVPIWLAQQTFAGASSGTDMAYLAVRLEA